MKTISLFIAALGLTRGQDLPEWYTIFPVGRHEVEGKGTYLVTKDAFTMVKAQIDRRGNEVVFDYEHQTIAGTKAPAAGWCRDWRWTEGVGIEAKIDWTEEAAEFLKKGEYRYYSPVFHVRKSDELLCAVHSVALTNAPRTNHLKPLLAKLGAEFNNEEDKEKSMDLMKLLIAALKLDDNADEKTVLAAVQKLTEQPKEVVSKAIVAALGIEETDESTVVASIHALRQSGRGMVSQADFDALQVKIVERDATEFVAKAMADGKITPDQQPWAIEYAKRDPDGFQIFVSKAPVVMPMAKLPKGDTQVKTDISDETVLAVAKMMDVGAEDLKTFGGLA